MGFLNNLTSAFGLSGKAGGGTRDAFSQYESYINSISPIIEQRRAEIASQGYNPFINQLGQSYQGLSGQFGQSRQSLLNLVGSSRLIPQQLMASSLASSSGAQLGALQAARQAGAGRGGLAFGGGAGAIAAYGGQEASVNQSSALSNALLQGNMFSLGYEADIAKSLQGQDQLSLALANSQNQSTAQQAGLAEAYRNRLDDLSMVELQGRFGLAGGALGGGLAGQQGIAQNRFKVFQQMFGSQQAGQISNAALGAIKIGG